MDEEKQRVGQDLGGFEGAPLDKKSLLELLEDDEVREKINSGVMASIRAMLAKWLGCPAADLLCVLARLLLFAHLLRLRPFFR